MLLRQHRSIDSLTEVVKTQANTIAGLVSLVGAGAAGSGAAAAAVPGPGRRADAAAGGGGRRRSSGNGGSGSGSGSGAVDDEDAIAEMVAYLDDDVAPAAPAAAVVGP